MHRALVLHSHLGQLQKDFFAVKEKKTRNQEQMDGVDLVDWGLAIDAFLS